MSKLQSTTRAITNQLNRLANLLDRSPWLCVAILLAATGPYLYIKAAVNHLTCDEVYTLRIAQQPTLAQMISVSRQIDLHPPLHYLAERASLATHLPLWVAARLSSILATLGTLVLLWSFTARRFGALCGLFTATVFWFSPTLAFGFSNRPYALWLFLLTLSAVLWQRAERNVLYALALFASVTLMVSDYMFGLACILPLALAELTRTLRTRRIVWPVWIALTLPSLSAVYYLRQLHDFATNSFAPQYLDWSGIATNTYITLATLPLTVTLTCALVAALLTRESATTAQAESSVVISHGETVLALAFFLLPALLAFMAGLHHSQFFPRYGACASVGLCLLLTAALARYVPAPKPTLALIAIALVIAAIVQLNDAPFVLNAPWRADRATGVPGKTLASLSTGIPLVIASPTGFTEMNANESASLLSHTYYLTNRPLALQYSGSTVFDDEGTAIRLLGFQGHAAPYADFLAQHGSFYMVADYLEPEEWLPRALVAAGAHLQYLGKLSTAYQDDDLYLVTH